MRDDTLHRIETSVNETKMDVVEIKTIVSTLATREFVHNAITDHYRNCSKGSNIKVVGTVIVSILTAVGALIVALSKLQ